MDNIFISLILPIYNEAGNIPELYRRCTDVLKQYESYEIIFVNDGSQDNSFALLSEKAQTDSHIKIINFSRNFGHQIAITAGMDYARGQATIIMDSDLQDPPEVIPALVQRWREGFEVVYAKRRTRRDSFFKRLTAFCFYRFLKMFSSIDIPTDTGDFRLLDCVVVDALKSMREHSRFMRGLTSWTGFRQSFILFDRADRTAGMTNYPLHKMITFAIDGITSFSIVPLRLATYVGFCSAFIGLIGGAYALYYKFFLPADATVRGWTSLVIAIFFLGGIQLIMLGIIGEYIGRMYIETQRRPLYLVSKKINFIE